MARLREDVAAKEAECLLLQQVVDNQTALLADAERSVSTQAELSTAASAAAEEVSQLKAKVSIGSRTPFCTSLSLSVSPLLAGPAICSFSLPQSPLHCIIIAKSSSAKLLCPE